MMTKTEGKEDVQIRLDSATKTSFTVTATDSVNLRSGLTITQAAMLNLIRVLTWASERNFINWCKLNFHPLWAPTVL